MIMQDLIDGTLILVLGVLIVFLFLGIMIGLMKLNRIISERVEKAQKGGDDAAVAAAAATYLKMKRQ